MANWMDSKMPTEQKEQATRILKEFSLDNLKVHFDSKNKNLVFDQDRRVVSVPVRLVENELWHDIRFLFRATLEAPNSLWNNAADNNDWSGTNYYKK